MIGRAPKRPDFRAAAQEAYREGEEAGRRLAAGSPDASLAALKYRHEFHNWRNRARTVLGRKQATLDAAKARIERLRGRLPDKAPERGAVINDEERKRRLAWPLAAFFLAVGVVLLLSDFVIMSMVLSTVTGIPFTDVDLGVFIFRRLDEVIFQLLFPEALEPWSGLILITFTALIVGFSYKALLERWHSGKRAERALIVAAVALSLAMIGALAVARVHTPLDVVNAEVGSVADAGSPFEQPASPFDVAAPPTDDAAVPTDEAAADAQGSGWPRWLEWAVWLSFGIGAPVVATLCFVVGFSAIREPVTWLGRAIAWVVATAGYRTHLWRAGRAERRVGTLNATVAADAEALQAAGDGYQATLKAMSAQFRYGYQMGVQQLAGDKPGTGVRGIYNRVMPLVTANAAFDADRAINGTNDGSERDRAVSPPRLATSDSRETVD